MDLKNIHWGEFVFENIFNIFSTNSGIDKNKLNNKKGNIPYITRSDKNNAIDFFIGFQDEKFKVDNGNVITIGLDTQTVFYQSHKFYTGQNIQILSNDNINFFNSQFLIPLIKKQMGKFNWGGNGATLTRLRRSKLLLPSNENDEPDFAFMEQYMRQKEQEKVEKFTKYISKRIEALKDFQEVESLNQKEWGEFEIGKLFRLHQGKSKGLNHLKKSEDGVNYLGATNSNNGVLSSVQIVGNEKMIQRGNCIAFIRNGEGSMGFSIYKAEKFIATSDISVGYSQRLNRHIGLFITTIADTVRGKYNFGYKRNETRLKKEKLQLPINSIGEPDYEYMENYIKKLEYQKLTKYIENTRHISDRYLISQQAVDKFPGIGTKSTTPEEYLLNSALRIAAEP